MKQSTGFLSLSLTFEEKLATLVVWGNHMQFYFGNNQLSEKIQALKSIDSHG